uniref:Pectinesterase inhibitor domain-containing protein n=1 Tax=Oryza brachyantha TaxID=4533 RepID=J3MQ66_ORYBR
MASSRSAYGSQQLVVLAVLVSLALLPLLGMAASTATYPTGSFCSEISDSNFIARRRSVNSLLAGLTAKARSNGGVPPLPPARATPSSTASRSAAATSPPATATPASPRPPSRSSPTAATTRRTPGCGKY